jgi:hypothetical protein
MGGIRETGLFVGDGITTLGGSGKYLGWGGSDVGKTLTGAGVVGWDVVGSAVGTFVVGTGVGDSEMGGSVGLNETGDIVDWLVGTAVGFTVDAATGTSSAGLCVFAVVGRGPVTAGESFVGWIVVTISDIGDISICGAGTRVDFGCAIVGSLLVPSVPPVGS